jgi:hypothetical protein
MEQFGLQDWRASRFGMTAVCRRPFVGTIVPSCQHLQSALPDG